MSVRITARSWSLVSWPAAVSARDDLLCRGLQGRPGEAVGHHEDLVARRHEGVRRRISSSTWHEARPAYSGDV